MIPYSDHIPIQAEEKITGEINISAGNSSLNGKISNQQQITGYLVIFSLIHRDFLFLIFLLIL